MLQNGGSGSYQGRHRGPSWSCAELEGMGCPQHKAVLGMCLAKRRQELGEVQVRGGSYEGRGGVKIQRVLDFKEPP